MKIDWRFLSSKVARRIFGLFVICSLIPIVTLTAVSFRFVTRELDEQTRRRLHAAAKGAGMEIMARLETLETELRIVGSVWQDSAIETTPEAGGPFVHLAHHFEALAIADHRGSSQVLLGTPIPVPPLDVEQRQHLERGKPLLVIMHRDRADRPALLMMIRLKSERRDEAPLMIGSLADAFLWGEELPTTRSDETDLAVLDPAGRLLHATHPRDVPYPDEATQQMTTRARGDFTWSAGETSHVSSYWWLFLKPRYGYSHWVLLLTDVQAEAFAPLAEFRRMLPLVVGLSLSVVMLLSVIQIRRSLIPLEELKRGTEAITGQDFNCRVDVRSKDEFEQLATSFNAMASRLGRQFKTLATLSDIDRAILSTLDRKEIVRTVLGRLPEIVSADCVAVTLLEPSAPGHAEVYTRIRVAPEEVRQRVILMPEERERFLDHPGGVLRFRPQNQPPHLSILSDLGMRCGVALPIMVKRHLAGIVTLAYRSDVVSADEDLVEARRLATQVAVALSNAHLIEEHEQLNRETLHTLARAIDAKSPWTAGHSERVTRMAVRIGETMGFPEDQLDVIQRGGLLHDIGKIGVPRSVLDKPGPLTTAEMDQMKDHVRIGARILEPISAYTGERLIVLYHHERFNGTGYPEGLAGENIPLNARVLGLADVFDALISERPYRSGWSRDKVIEHIQSESGKHFDPRIVEAFMRMIQLDREFVEPRKESFG